MYKVILYKYKEVEGTYFMEQYYENMELLNSVTILYFNYNKTISKDDELKNILEKYTKNLITVSTIDEAKSKITGYDIDILITDFSLTDKESVEFPLFIRRQNPSCSIIIYTDKNDADHMLEAIDLKVDKYLIKPCSNKEIIKVVLNAAEYCFTLKSLYSNKVDNTTHLDTSAYDTLSQSIDELRIVISKIAPQNCMEAMPVIHSLKNIIDNLKLLLKSSY